MDKTSGHSQGNGDLSHSPAFGAQARDTGSIHADSRTPEARPLCFRIPRSLHFFSDDRRGTRH
jgi:hypothetical protein